MSTVRTVHSPLTFAFVPRGPSDRELEWFFAMAEVDMGNRSMHLDNLLGIPVWSVIDDTFEIRAEAVHAQRKIREWLVDLGSHDAGVLQAAYSTRPWPLALREALGRIVGIMIRIRASEYGLPDDDHELDALERQVAAELEVALDRHDPILVRLQQASSPVFKRAFDAYVRKRGGRDHAVLAGVS